MNQKLPIAIFFTSLPTFLITTSEVLKMHNSWQEFTTPVGVAHIFVLTASFIGIIVGALGINLPREQGSKNRKTDPEKCESKKDDNGK